MSTSKPQPAAVEHAAVSFLNSSGHGIRTIIGCSCGEVPAKGATGASTMHASHARHRRGLGLPRFDYRRTVIGPGYAASGLTWDEWNASDRAGQDPYLAA